MTHQLLTKDDFETIQRLAKLFMESGLFADTKSLAQAVVKILAGSELGIGPFESMRDLAIIQGKTTMAGSQIAAKIKRSGVYDYEILKFDASEAELQFTKNGKPLQPKIRFDLTDAKRMGLDQKDNYKKQARTMLFWRAVTMGARMHCPEIFGGAIYTPDELTGGRVAEPLLVEAPARALPAPTAPVRTEQDRDPADRLMHHMGDVVKLMSGSELARDNFLKQAADVFGAAEVEEAVAKVEAEPMNTGGTYQAVGRPATEKQMVFFSRLMKKHHLPEGSELAIVHCITGQQEMTSGAISKVIEALKADDLPDIINEYIDELEASKGE